MLLVPAMILFLVQAPQIRETDLSSLRLIVYGAAPIPADLLRQAMGIFPLRLPAGLRPHRDDGRHHPAAARRPRPGRRQEAPVLRLRRRKAWSCASSATTARTWRPARSARSPCARRRSWAATGTCPTRTPARHPGRLVLHRRRGLPRRQGLSLHLRPREGHDRVGRREHLSGRGRERPVRPSRRRRRCRDRRARRALGRGGEGRRGQEARRRPERRAS